MNVLSYDYRGYGISKAKISEKSTYEDLEYVISFAQEKLHYNLSNIILWGFSLGTGPTVELASRYQNIGGVVLQAPLASLLVWMDKSATWDYQYSSDDIYCSINKIESIRSKIFIIHGKKDHTIDCRHSNLLYEKYVNSSKDNNQIWLVLAEGVGHNEIQFLVEDEGGIFYKRIMKFIELVKYPLFLRENSLLKHHPGKALKEENKRSFLEKEVKSLKISYNMLQINEYLMPSQLGKSWSAPKTEESDLNELDPFFLEKLQNLWKEPKNKKEINEKESTINSLKNNVFLEEENEWVLEGLNTQPNTGEQISNDSEEEINVPFENLNQYVKENHF